MMVMYGHKKMKINIINDYKKKLLIGEIKNKGINRNGNRTKWKCNKSETLLKQKQMHSNSKEISYIKRKLISWTD